MSYVLYSKNRGRESYLVRLVADFIPRVTENITQAMAWDSARGAYDWAGRRRQFSGWRVRRVGA